MRRYHFIGIGGIAMGGVAVELRRAGHRVTGSDLQLYPPMSDYLDQHRVPVQQGFQADHVPENCEVVVGNAIPRGNAELEEALNRRLKLISLPELIAREFIGQRHAIVIAGTHGKTTTTAMVSRLFRDGGSDPGWMVGGVVPDLPASVHLGQGEHFIIEGDEYDTAFWDKRSKFLHYRPVTLVLNAVEFDHGDIFASMDEIRGTFRLLVRLVPQNGLLAVNGDDPEALRQAEEAFCPVLRFGLGTDNEYRGQWLDDGRACIQNRSGWEITLPVSLPGDHNLRNFTAAVLVAHERGLTDEVILRSLSAFQGPLRRLQKDDLQNGMLLVDDFAHHPTAIRLTLETVRRQYADRKLIALLEPRSNTMVRNIFQQELAEILTLADSIGIGRIHRREKYNPATLLDTDALVTSLRNRGHATMQSDDPEALRRFLLSEVKQNAVILVMSNGAFDGMADWIRSEFSAGPVGE